MNNHSNKNERAAMPQGEEENRLFSPYGHGNMPLRDGGQIFQDFSQSLRSMAPDLRTGTGIGSAAVPHGPESHLYTFPPQQMPAPPTLGTYANYIPPNLQSTPYPAADSTGGQQNLLFSHNIRTNLNNDNGHHFANHAGTVMPQNHGLAPTPQSNTIFLNNQIMNFSHNSGVGFTNNGGVTVHPQILAPTNTLPTSSVMIPEDVPRYGGREHAVVALPSNFSDGVLHEPKRGGRRIWSLEVMPHFTLAKLHELWTLSQNQAISQTMFARLPTNYRSYVHVRPAGQKNMGARDIYTYGHPSGRPFDSVNKFFVHFKHLMTNNGAGIANCDCELCLRSRRL